MRLFVLFCLLFLLNASHVLGQCPWSQTPPPPATPACSLDLVQLVGEEPVTDGLLFTRVWTATTIPAAHINSTINSGVDNIATAFPAFDANMLPAQIAGSSGGDTLLFPGPIINYNDTLDPNSLNPYAIRFDWPGAGDDLASGEQVQQDGWLVIPDSIPRIIFRMANNTEKSVRLYLSDYGNPPNNNPLNSMNTIFNIVGGANSSGGVANWCVPPGLPRFGPSMNFRYTRLRLYYFNPRGFANATLEWDIGNGFEPIPRNFLQSVPEYDRIDNEPTKVRPRGSTYYLRDQDDSLFNLQSPSIYGPTINGTTHLPDPLFREQVETKFNDAFVPNTCTDTFSFSCGNWTPWEITRIRPNLSGEAFQVSWTSTFYEIPVATTQLEYREAFNGTNPPPSHNNPTVFDGAGPVTVSGLGFSRVSSSTPNPEQYTQDLWLAVPAHLKYIDFQLGDHPPHEQASALWVGTEFSSMIEVASQIGAEKTIGTFAIPNTAPVIPNQSWWRWLRVKVYTHNKFGTVNSLIKWNLGQGFEEVEPYYIAPAQSNLDSIPPTLSATDFTPEIIQYVLEDSTGLFWEANGTSPPSQRVSLRYPYHLEPILDTLMSCGAPNTLTIGPSCQATLIAEPCNDPPIAQNDSFTVIVGVTTVLTGILNNDFDPNPSDSNALQITSIFGVTTGVGVVSISGNGTTITYTPSGADSTSFYYIVCDDASPAECDTAVIYIIVLADGDGDQIPDIQDLDHDNDGISNQMEAFLVLNGGNFDGDTIVDQLDLDSDNDGVPDIIEAGGIDPDKDGRVPLNPNGTLVNDPGGNGWDPSVVSSTIVDTDGDGFPDAIDLDSDNDGIFDLGEATNFDSLNLGYIPLSSNTQFIQGWSNNYQQFDSVDTDLDGIPERLDLDSDNDGIPNILEEGNLDSDNDGRLGVSGIIYDPDQNGAHDTLMTFGIMDQDGDTLPNYLDLDADNDGIPDVLEGGGIGSNAQGGHGSSITDSNLDGWEDGDSLTGYLQSDSDPLPDFLDLDSDNDGAWDILEAGTATFNSDGQVSTFNVILHRGWHPTDRIVSERNTDNDSLPDRRDLDSDNDGLADLAEFGLPDSIFDGQVDNFLDTLNGGDGADDLQTLDSLPNHDRDLLSNSRDLDSDNDAISDLIESGGTDADTNGMVDILANLPDQGWAQAARTPDTLNSDGDIFPNRIDLDSDQDGLYDLYENCRFELDTFLNFDRNGRIDSNWIPTISGWYKVVGWEFPSNQDGDLYFDYLDLDADNDGISDGYEAGVFPTSLTGSFNSITDSIPDGADDSQMRIEVFRSDEDNFPNHLDLDSDQDGIPDLWESGWPLPAGAFIVLSPSTDNDRNGWIDNPMDVPNTDSDSVSNPFDLDSDNDGLPDLIEWGIQSQTTTGTVSFFTDSTVVDGWDDNITQTEFLNSDGDVAVDHLDLDSDNDGVWDYWEVGGEGPLVNGRVQNFASFVYRGWSPTQRIELDLNSDPDLLPNRIDLDSDNDGISDMGENILRDSLVGQYIGFADLDSNGAYDSLMAPFLQINDRDPLPDFRDLDSDNDGIPDLWEAGWKTLQNLDTNATGQISDTTGIYEDGWSDNDRITGTLDHDGDLVPDHQDKDSDNDGFFDLHEGKTFLIASVDNNQDGEIDSLQIPITGWDPVFNNYIDLADTDQDGIWDHLDLDTDNDGLSDLFEDSLRLDSTFYTGTLSVPAQTPGGFLPNQMRTTLKNFDGDQFYNHMDLDSDNDGIPDVRESNRMEKADSSGRVDYLATSDIDENGWLDVIVWDSIDLDRDSHFNFLDLDSDNDGIPDVVEGSRVSERPLVQPIDTSGMLNGANTTTGWGPNLKDRGFHNFDSDAFPDWLDLDSDNDGIYDRLEARAYDHTNGTVGQVSSPDGWQPGFRIFYLWDTDLDEKPDLVDLDSDNDGISDLAEVRIPDMVSQDPDWPFDGQIDVLTDVNPADGADDNWMVSNLFADTLDPDRDSLPNPIDRDSDHDGLADLWEAGEYDGDLSGRLSVSANDPDGWSDFIHLDGLKNSDGDPVPDFLDLDSDQDGLYDLYEWRRFLGIDTLDNPPNGRIDFQASIPIDSTLGFPVVLSNLDERANTDKDDLPDHLDLDSDNDGLSDFFEKQPSSSNGTLGSIPNFNEGQVIDGADDAQIILIDSIADFDQDNVPNHLDLDSDQDGIPDLLESNGDDLNLNGLVDNLPTNDIDGWIDNPQDGAADFDGDKFFNQYDIDTDNDGIPDLVEASGIYDLTQGWIDPLTGIDADTNGWDDRYRLVSPIVTNAGQTPDYMNWDSDGDMIEDHLESKFDPFPIDIVGRIANPGPLVMGWDSIRGTVQPINSDAIFGTGDALPNYRDLDSDDDGISDSIEYLIPYNDSTQNYNCNLDSAFHASDSIWFSNTIDPATCHLEFFDGFSPNGDGLNDQFVANGMQIYLLRNLDVSFTVLNRWGAVVYDNPQWQGVWYGNCNQLGCDGKILPNGVYYYVCSVGQQILIKSRLHLRR